MSSNADYVKIECFSQLSIFLLHLYTIYFKFCYSCRRFHICQFLHVFQRNRRHYAKLRNITRITLTHLTFRYSIQIIYKSDLVMFKGRTVLPLLFLNIDT